MSAKTVVGIIVLHVKENYSIFYLPSFRKNQVVNAQAISR